MANQEHLDLLKQGVKVWNQWRQEHPDTQPDFRRANLGGANLGGVNLSGAKLNGIGFGGDIIGIGFGGADLGGAILSKANFRGADLRGANLRGANLDGIDLSGANLSGAILNRANFRNAVLRDAIIYSTIFAEIDLCKVNGLGEIRHLGPSYVELFSVQLPQDGSSLRFLRGAGVPDEWIADYRAHMMFPIVYYSCFISYSSQDELLAHRLYADLQLKGVRCWFAPEDMKTGDKIRERINQEIYVQEKLLLLLSGHSIESSWVEVEVEAALEKERQQKREVLFPIRLDGSAMQTTKAWATTIRQTRHITDFTGWKDQQVYQRAFERLLRDLKTEGKMDGKAGTS